MRLLAFGLNYLLSLVLVITPVSQTRATNASTLPVRVDGFGVEMSAMPTLTPENIEPILLKVKESGAGYIRQEINWSQVETTPDVYDWSAALPLDLLFATANTHKLKVVAVLTGGPVYLAASGEPVEQQALRDRWEKFVQAAVDHFGEYIDIWGISSNVNGAYALTSFLSPLTLDQPHGPDPALYARLLRSAARIIRDADPNDQVWLGTLGGFSAPDCAMNPLTFILEVNAAKGWNSFDAILYRPYQGSTSPEFPSSGEINSSCASNLMSTPTSIADEVRAVQELARQLGGKPVFISALGWNGDVLSALAGNREIHAGQVETDLLVRASSALMSHNSIPLIFWNADIYNNAEAYSALSNLQQVLHNTKPLGRLQGEDGNVHEYHFRKGGEVTVIAWRVQDGDTPYPAIIHAGDMRSFTAWSADSSELTKNTGLHIPAENGEALVMLNERPVIFLGRSGDLIISLRNSVEDQTELMQIELGKLMERLVNEAKSEFVHLLEKELDKAKDSALEWGENKLDELLP